jgi:molybdopterin-guanine dinucleotide biosynthesis protein A
MDCAGDDARCAKSGALPEYGEVTGVVLAGGMGRRMGRDKTALRLPDREQDFLAGTLGLLASVLSDVRVSCRADLPERLTRAGSYPVLPDHYPGGGALRAVYSALRHTGRPCLILACDMPFMRAELLVALLEARQRRPAASVQTVWRSPDGALEPLAAVYEPQALPLLEQAIQRDEYRLALAVPSELRHCLDYGANQATAFHNVNFPLDFKTAQVIASGP